MKNFTPQFTAGQHIIFCFGGRFTCGIVISDDPGGVFFKHSDGTPHLVKRGAVASTIVSNPNADGKLYKPDLDRLRAERAERGTR